MKLILALITLISAHPILALPLDANLFYGSSFGADTQESTFDFEGIVKLSGCSGALVRFNTTIDSDRAVIMTNGHCITVNGEMLKPNVHVANLPEKRQFALLSKDGQSKVATLNSTRVLYATITGHDLALYELVETYEQISARVNINALIVSSERSQAGVPIEIISGYWKRGYRCTIDGFVHELREGGYTWRDAIRYEMSGACLTVHGTSGSPILHAATRALIGINNTGNDDGKKCDLNNPCEVNEHGVVFAEEGISYGQQTYQIYTCLNERNKLDLAMPGCKLFKN